jgi:SAM-dependent methyltransferase
VLAALSRSPSATALGTSSSGSRISTGSSPGVPCYWLDGPRGRARGGDGRAPRARGGGAGGGELTEPIRSKSGLQEFYDDPKVVETYLERKRQPLGAVLHGRQVAFLNRVIADLRPARVLEVAPGPARLSAELTPVPFSVGMDFSPRMLGEAQRRTRARELRWSFVRGDGFRLPFARASFDLAFSVRFVRRWEPAQRQLLYAEMRRVLRPGGHLVLDAQNRLVAARTARDATAIRLRRALAARRARRRARGSRLRGAPPRGHDAQFAWQWRLHRLRRFGLGGPARLPHPRARVDARPESRPRGWCSAGRRTGDVRIAYVIPAYPPAASQPFVVNEMVEVQERARYPPPARSTGRRPSAVRHATFERFRPVAVLPPAMVN